MMKIFKHICLLALLNSSFSISTANAMEDMKKSQELVPNKTVKSTVSTGILYLIENKESKNVLNFNDAHKGGDLKVTGQPRKDTQWDSHRLFVLVEDRDGFYFIKNQESGNVLNFYDAHKGGNLKVKGQPRKDAQWDSHRLFTLVEDRDGFYFIKNKESGNILTFNDANKGGDNLKVEGQIRKDNKLDSHMLFKFIPFNYKLRAVIEDFKYDPIVYQLSLFEKKVSSVAWTVSNQSHQTADVHHPEIFQKVMNSSSWSFTKSTETNFLNQLDVDISAGYCGIKGNVHNTTKWENKTTSLEESKKADLDETVISLKSDITVPPRKRVEYVITWEKIEADIPFRALVKIKGVADRLTKDGRIASLEPLEGDGVLSLIHYLGYKGQILSVIGKDVLAEITGSVHISGATKGIIDKHEYNL